MPTCQGRYAPPEAVALLLPQARTILKYALFYHGGRHLQKILNIADNKVTVSENLKKGDITSEFTLTFTAYAVQKDGVNDAVTAWGKLPTSTTP